jgi:predicted dehydrogenase
MTGEANRIQWGVLGTARIATAKVIPAMQRGRWSGVAAIASRDESRAEAAARGLGIPRVYGSYEDLLADSDIHAVYIPLPNHLHVPWTIRAAEAGKHVLCEKPIGLTAAEAQQLLAVRDRTGVLIQEAFMIRSHPQWVRTRELVRGGAIGELRAITGSFSYYNDDPRNIRNVREWGGGGLMDIGCYLVHVSRMLFEREPRRVCALMEQDPRMGIDRLTSLLLDFEGGHAIGTCATQLVPYQRVEILGTRGRIEISIPFNAPPDRPLRILVDDGSDLTGAGVRTTEFEVCDQYTLQGDLFSRAILEGGPAPYPLEDSILNMRVIDAITRSAGNAAWSEP